LGEWRCSSTHSLTSALDGGEWSASRPSRFTPRERAPSTHWIGGWVGPRAVLDATTTGVICNSNDTSVGTKLLCLLTISMSEMKVKLKVHIS